MKAKVKKIRYLVPWNTGSRWHKPKKGKGSYDRKSLKSGKLPDFFVAFFGLYTINNRV